MAATGVRDALDHWVTELNFEAIRPDFQSLNPEEQLIAFLDFARVLPVPRNLVRGETLLLGFRTAADLREARRLWLRSQWPRRLAAEDALRSSWESGGDAPPGAMVSNFFGEPLLLEQNEQYFCPDPKYSEHIKFAESIP
jgi:hypothetical protein